MQTDNLKLQVLIGFFVLTAITITMLMVVYMTGGVRLGGQAYYVIVTMENIGELKIGAPVRYGGVEIGKIKNISIRDANVEITAGINNEFNIQKDTRARIGTAGLVGDAFLEFTRGVSPEYLPKISMVEQSPRVVGEKVTSMGDMMMNMQGVGKEIQEMVHNVNLLIAKDSFRENIERSVANVNQFTGEISVAITNVRGTLNKVNAVIDNVAEAINDVQKPLQAFGGFINQLFVDPQLAEHLNSLISSVRSVAETLARQKDNIALVMKNINTATGNVAAITGSIAPGQGLLRLLSDERAGAEVMMTIASLQRAARAIATVGISDFIADKYVGEKIAEQWLANRKGGTSEQTAREWKAWMAQQKNYAERMNYSPYAAASNVAPEQIEFYYESADSTQSSTAAKKTSRDNSREVNNQNNRPIPAKHPLADLYNHN